MNMRVDRADYSMAHQALAELCHGFFAEEYAALCAEAVEPNQVPPPFYELLVHPQHMTTTLQTYYGRPVQLCVLRQQLARHSYRRKILLTLAETQRVVEFGLMRVDLHYLGSAVRDEILAQQKPLGEILIRHNVLRQVNPLWYFRFPRASPVWGHFEVLDAPAVYGRLGVILCDGQPAIHVLEVVPGIHP